MICNNCMDYLPIVKPPVCSICGRPIKKGYACVFCANKSNLDHGRAWMLFVPPSDKIIHHFKYRRKTHLAHLLGRAMAGLIRADYVLSKANIIVSVPLFWWKKFRRGYNQAHLIARVISQETGIESRDILRRVKHTRTQTRLSEYERQKNVMNAFATQLDGIRDSKIIIVDDVLTTGATMNECARVLKENGAAEVYSCVAAITPG